MKLKKIKEISGVKKKIVKKIERVQNFYDRYL